MSWTQDQAAMLIECYEEHPCLYAVKHNAYKNKHARTSALQEILSKLKVIKPDTTIAEIKTKFGALRTNFLNEHRKYAATKNKSGEGTDEIYQPSIWYYKKMLFLLEHSTPRKPAYDSINLSLAEYNEENSILESNSEILMSPLYSFDIPEDQIDDPMTLSISRASSADISKELATPSTTRASSVDNLIREHSTPSTSRVENDNVLKGKGKKRKIDNESAFLENATSALNKIAANTGVQPKETNNKLDNVGAFLTFLETKLRRITDEEILDDVEDKILQTVQEGYKKCMKK